MNDIIRFTNGDDGVFAHVSTPEGKHYGVNVDHLADGDDLVNKFFAAVAERVRAGEPEHQCCGKCEKPAGPQFAKVFQTERGQIVAMLHQDSEQNPAILLWFDAGIDGLALSHLAFGFTDDEDGEDKARTAFDNLDRSGVERVVFKQIDDLRELFEVAP